MTFKLNIDDRDRFDAPTPKVVAQQLEGMDEEEFAILRKSGSEFVQVMLEDDGEVLLQYRDEPNADTEADPEMFQADENAISITDIVKFFQTYMAGGDWKSMFQWSPVDLERVDYAVAICCPESEIAAFDPTEREQRIDFAEMTAECVIQLCCLLLETDQEDFAQQIVIHQTHEADWFVLNDTIVNELQKVSDVSTEAAGVTWFSIECFPDDLYDEDEAVQLAEVFMELIHDAVGRGWQVAICNM